MGPFENSSADRRIQKDLPKELSALIQPYLDLFIQHFDFFAFPERRNCLNDFILALPIDQIGTYIAHN